ncbi:MAG: HAD family hydrolase [Opitutales bacterium]
MNRAVLWDWDGVVIDSSRQHELSWERLARELDKALPEGHFKRGFGKKNEVIIPEILAWATDPEEVARLGRRKEAIYREILREPGFEPRALPGAADLVKALQAAGVPSVIATSTERANVEVALDVLGLRDAFCGIVSADDVSRGKPDPEVFLTAADRAGAKPEHCIVLEDSTHGIEAGLAGGMAVVAVATTNTEVELADSGAQRVVHRLTALSVPALRQLVPDR